MLGRNALSAALLAVLMATGTAACISGDGYAVREPDEVVMVSSRGGQVPAGTTLWLRVEPGANWAGRPIRAVVATEVVSTGGDLLVPQGTRVHGFVTAGRNVEVQSIDMAGVRQPISGYVVETRGDYVAVRLTEPIESYASLSYRRFY